MGSRMLAGAVALAVLGTGGLGWAQDATKDATKEPTVDSAQKQDFPAQPQAQGVTKVPHGTVPPPPHAQPEAPLADQAKPAAVGPAQANTTDDVSDGVPLGATPQTMPSTMSEQNAALDKLPIGALQLPLSDEKRHFMAETLRAVPDTTGSSAVSDLDVTAFLPTGVPLESFPAEVVRQIPETGRYKYVKRDGMVFIIDPPNMTVVGEIPL